jgi:hypothetical protein
VINSLWRAEPYLLQLRNATSAGSATQVDVDVQALGGGLTAPAWVYSGHQP